MKAKVMCSNADFQENVEQFLDDLLMDVVEACEEQKLAFALEYGVNNKGFNTYKIVEIFED